MHEVLVNRLGGPSLSRKSVVRLTDCLDMTLDVYRGRKTTIQQQYVRTVTRDGFNEASQCTYLFRNIENYFKSIPVTPTYQEL